MRSSTIVSLVIGLGVVGGMAFAARAGNAQEEEVTLDQVPAAVKATILREAAGAEITEIEREVRNGKTVYEAEFLQGGQAIEIKVAPDGTVLAREVEDEDDNEDDITFDQIPAPARMALQQLAGGAKILKAEREKEHGALVYEAEWSVNGASHEAAVTAEGALLEIEEIIPVEKAPAAVRAAIAKHFGARATVVVEKKMIVLYEVAGRINGQQEELLVFPTGRVIAEPDDDDDDDDGDDDDDDGDEGDDDDD